MSNLFEFSVLLKGLARDEKFMSGEWMEGTKLVTLKEFWVEEITGFSSAENLLNTKQKKTI